MFKRITTAALCLVMALAVMPNFSDNAAAEPTAALTLDFSDENMQNFESAGNTMTIGESLEGGIVKDEFDHSGEGAAVKVTHIEGASYSSLPNGVQVALAEPLPANTVFSISAWFYIPEEGNTEGKQNLLGPGVLVNGRADSNAYKYPASEQEAGIVKFDEWMNVTYETPTYEDELASVFFRFYTNAGETHPDVYYLDDISITVLETAEAVNDDVQEFVPLKDIYKDYFLLGTAGVLFDMPSKRLDLITKHFNAFTHGNELKPISVQPAEGKFTFEDADSMIDSLVAVSEDMSIVGHTLFWHEQSPEWMWEDKDKAKERLETHIETVLSHAIDKAGDNLISFDVINEAFRDGAGNGNWRAELRDSGWLEALGPEMIEIAFNKADEVRNAKGRPDIKLYYNDYNLDYIAKATSVYDMVTELRGNGVPIDGIGMQAHYNMGTKPENVRKSIELFHSIPGIEVSVTELDITVDSSRGNSGLSEEEDLAQAKLYAELMSIYKEYAIGPANPDESKRLISRVTIWGTTDSQSWRGDRFPLIFDKDNKAKGAFYGVAFPDDYEAYISGEKSAADYEIPASDAQEEAPAADDSETEAAAETEVGSESPEAEPADATVSQDPASDGAEEESGVLSAILFVAGGVIVLGAICFAAFRKKKD